MRALSADIARHGVQTIVAESLHYHPLEHGYHHERYFLHLGARTASSRTLLLRALRRGRPRPASMVAVQRWAQNEIQRSSTAARTHRRSSTRPRRGRWRAGSSAATSTRRAEAVASLVADASAAAAEEDAVFAFLDASGAIKGYADGRPAGGPAAEIAWRLGVDPGAVARACGRLEAIAYAADPDRVRLDLEAYRALLPQDGSLSAAMRPTLPDCDSTENLAEKLGLARELGLERVDLYHYGFAPLPPSTGSAAHSLLTDRPAGWNNRRGPGVLRKKDTMNRAVAFIPTQASSAADVPHPVMGRTPEPSLRNRIRDLALVGRRAARARPQARPIEAGAITVPRCDCSGEGRGRAAQRWAASTCSAARSPLRSAPSISPDHSPAVCSPQKTSGPTGSVRRSPVDPAGVRVE